MAAPLPTPHPPSASPLTRLLVNRPVVAFFVLSHALSWLAWLPLLLAQNSLGMLPVRLPLTPFLALAYPYTG